MTSQMATIEEGIAEALGALNLEASARRYREQNEFFHVERFLAPAVVGALLDDVRAVRNELNRNYIPGHKKGGSISSYTLFEKAPAIVALYRSPALIEFLSRLAGARLLLCPEQDPHACALYFYTEPGDHIGFHYDTSYYRGARYTVLIGLVERSTSRLVCRLYKDDPARTTQELALATDPGCLIFFNGDKLYHAVTPLGEGEERIVLTLQYVTNPEMGLFKRLFSDLKDGFAYFGMRTLLRRKLFGR
jgi:hypothetical protein